MTEYTSNMSTNNGRDMKTISLVRSTLLPNKQATVQLRSEKHSSLYSNIDTATTPHRNGTESVKRKAVTLSPQNDAPGISVNTNNNAHPIAVTPRSSSATQVKTVRFDQSDARERRIRTPHNVSTLGNVASQESNTFEPKYRQPSAAQPSSTYQAFTAMVQNDQFDIDFVPQTYKQAMQSNNSHKWQ
jgi:hypothetical protein